MYVEHQSPGDDMCRMHALNAVLGGPVITLVEFKRLANKWQALEASPDTLMFESVHSDGRSFLAFALEECIPDCVAHYVPWGGGVAALAQDDPEGHVVSAVQRAIEFSDTHTWALVNTKGTWWRLDSLMHGPRAVLPLPQHLDNRHGYVLVLPRSQESRDALFQVLDNRIRRILSISENEVHPEHKCLTLYENLETAVWAYAQVAARCGTPLPEGVVEAAQAARFDKCGIQNVARTLAFSCMNFTQSQKA